MKPLLLLLACFFSTQAVSQIPVPAGYDCGPRGFCKDSLFLTDGKLPRKTKSLTEVQRGLERSLNGNFRITNDNIVLGSGFNSIERCYWFAAGSTHSDHFVIALSPHNDAAFHTVVSWLLVQARDAAALSRKWIFVDAAGRYCSDGMLLRN